MMVVSSMHDIPPVPKGVPEKSENQPEEIQASLEINKGEKKETFESAKNVAELIDGWKERYKQDETTDGEKMELSNKILKMEMALGICGLEAKNVKIRRDNESDTVGLYNEVNGEVAITPAGLELPAEHYADVFVHEARAHKGIGTGRRIFDEGLAEILTKKILPGAMSGYYEQEQSAVKKTFRREGIDPVLKKYDYDHPVKLALFYFGAELKYLWQNQLKTKFDEASQAKNFDSKQFLSDSIEKNKNIEKLFKKGVPDLYKHLKQMGFDIKSYEAKMFEQFFEQAQ